MTDLADFYYRMREGLLDMAAKNQGVLQIEAERRYHTDTKFHAQVNAICTLAIRVLQDMEEGVPTPNQEYTEIFKKEVSELLGWTDE